MNGKASLVARINDMNQQISIIDQFKTELDSNSNLLAEVLPKHLPIERFKRAAIIAVTNNPGVLDADRTSLFNSLQKCAIDGLVPDNKEAALVEFSTKINNHWIKKIQYMPMVDGVLKRARQSGEVANITARAVYANDSFDYWIDEDGEHLNHRPTFASDRGDMILVYAMAKMKTGDVIVEPMSMDDIIRVRNSSKNPDKGPWKNWFDRMALKSSLHRLARRLPNSSEVMEMLDQGNFLYNFGGAEKERDVTPQPHTESTEGKSQRLADRLKTKQEPIVEQAQEIDMSSTKDMLLSSIESCINNDDLQEIYDAAKAQLPEEIAIEVGKACQVKSQTFTDDT